MKKLKTEDEFNNFANKALKSSNLEERLNNLIAIYNGGPGSGNFGHLGRPGLVGGSAPKNLGPSGLLEAVCGVPGDATSADIKTIPKLKGLNKKQKQIENEANSKWDNEKTREKIISNLVDRAERSLEEKGQVLIETDAIKEDLCEGWGSGKEFGELSKKYENFQKKTDLELKLNKLQNEPKSKQNQAEIKETIQKLSKLENAKPLTAKEQARFDELRAFRAENNSLLHQAANAFAKATFERVAQKHQGVEMAMTSGGCASGKGFGLENSNLFTGTYKGKSLSDVCKNAKIVWDAAGEQCSAEANWFIGQAKKNKASNITIVHTETNSTAAAKNAAFRVDTKGRLVSFEAFYNSYVNSRKNIQKVVQQYKNDDSVNIITVRNMGKGAKDKNGVPYPLEIIGSGGDLPPIASKSSMKKEYAKALENAKLPGDVLKAAQIGMEFTFQYE